MPKRPSLKDLREDILPALWELDCVAPKVTDGKIVARSRDGISEVVILTVDELKSGVPLVKTMHARLQECRRKFKVIHHD